MAARAILHDIRRCRGCSACVLACRESHGEPKDPPHDTLRASARLAVTNRGGRFVRRSCMHCLDPACASVCPVGALRRTESGAVAYRADLCMGCRYCMVACPFDVPRYTWNERLPVMHKCDFCAERAAAGLSPACASVCPFGSLMSGDRDTLVAEAKSRIDEGGYVERIYGIREAGGTSVLMISDVPFDELGFPPGLPDHAMPQLTWAVLKEIPRVVSGMGVGLAALWWVIERRRRVAEELS